MSWRTYAGEVAERQRDKIRAILGSVARWLLLLAAAPLLHGHVPPVLGWVVDGLAQEIAGGVVSLLVLLWSLRQKKAQQKLLESERLKLLIATSPGNRRVPWPIE